MPSSRFEVNANRFPSGDHCGKYSNVDPVVSWRASPPAADITKTWPEVNAMFRLSGDHDGFWSAPGPVVSWTAGPPSEGITQILRLPLRKE
jgi:hypothetical protein